VIPAGTKPGDILSVNVPSAAAVAVTDVSVVDDTADADEMVRVEKKKQVLVAFLLLFSVGKLLGCQHPPPLEFSTLIIYM
jgi:hypothetical protein